MENQYLPPLEREYLLFPDKRQRKSNAGRRQFLGGDDKLLEETCALPLTLTGESQKKILKDHTELDPIKHRRIPRPHLEEDDSTRPSVERPVDDHRKG
ncbi:hypothetical protein TNIN_291871 [Trichonephila inaurata madagascariensis]|uniref:Uncharacterized protein n=1 Tax=Trichonephila inaurata madagascariensis TaxID=2747483 RepID=A0A8X6XH41_9ARAC|nr:hypothetical protein TNIN_291871 [Trichonephila inaurata madagascariensis]